MIGKYLIIMLLFSVPANTGSVSKNNLQVQKTIIVYGSDTCHYCVDTKTYLKERDIEFTYYDVDVNKEKEQEMIMKLRQAKIPLSALSLPVIDKGGKVFTNGKNFDTFLKKIIE